MAKIPVLLDQRTTRHQEGTLGLLDGKSGVLEVDAEKLRSSLAMGVERSRLQQALVDADPARLPYLGVLLKDHKDLQELQ